MKRWEKILYLVFWTLSVDMLGTEALLDLPLLKPLSRVVQVADAAVKSITDVVGNDLIPLLPIDVLLRPYENPTFCYELDKDCGPNKWSGECNAGKRQSPVDLFRPMNGAPGGMHPPVLHFQAGWDTPKNIWVSNNGHSVVVRFGEKAETDCSIHLADVGRTYNLSHVHFHWGSDSGKGSEHLVHGKAYAMEVHFVHYDVSYGSLENAFKNGGPDAAAVIGVFVQAGPHNYAYDAMVKELGGRASSSTKGYAKTDKVTFLRSLLPTRYGLFRYQGSLTVPPCTEKVSWIVMEEPIYMSEEQLKIFRKIHCGHNIDLSNNFRPVQPLHDRTIRYSMG